MLPCIRLFKSYKLAGLSQAIFFLSVSFSFAFAASLWFSNVMGNGRDYQWGSLKSFSFIKQTSWGVTLGGSQLFVHLRSQEGAGTYTARCHRCFLSTLGCFGGPVIADRAKRPPWAVKWPAALPQISALLRDPRPVPDTPQSPVGTHCSAPAGLREVARHAATCTGTAWRHV